MPLLENMSHNRAVQVSFTNKEASPSLENEEIQFSAAEKKEIITYDNTELSYSEISATDIFPQPMNKK